MYVNTKLNSDSRGPGSCELALGLGPAKTHTQLRSGKGRLPVYCAHAFLVNSENGKRLSREPQLSTCIFPLVMVLSYRFCDF